MCLKSCVLKFVLLSGSLACSVQASGPLPLQHIVFLIDNSGSMDQSASDPLRMRGVAASLILDAAELSSRVEAGLVHFSDQVDTDGRLHSPSLIRERLQSDRLPKAQGNTNMPAALESGINMLTNSTADLKKIIMITDGSPDSGTGQSGANQQIKTIREVLIPQAKQAGIVLLALGLSRRVNEPFLIELTHSTGGRAEISERPDQLLETAKSLLGERENVYTIERSRLGATQMSYQFELPPGSDRARITAILDNPHVFSPAEIELELTGPDTGDGGRLYRVTDKTLSERVAAWTTFVSAAGKYRLQVRTDKPGIKGHRGLLVFVEALSTLKIELIMSPPGQNYYAFGEEIRIDASVTSASGTVEAAVAQVTGAVQTADGGSVPLAFNGGVATFKVPDVAGRQTIRVEVRTSGKLGFAEGEMHYRAGPPEPVLLEASKRELKFAAELGPENPVVEASFKVYVVYPEGAKDKRVKIAATLSAPMDSSLTELVTGDGGRIRSTGTHEYPIPEGGLEITLRISMKSDRILRVDGRGPYKGQIRLFSKQASNELVLPFQLDIRIPSFEMSDVPASFALWWDPERERQIILGNVSSDASIDTSFHASIPEAISEPNHGPRVGGLQLLFEADISGSPSDSDAGKLRFGPVPLTAGETSAIQLRFTPAVAWELRQPGPREITVDLESSLGADTQGVLTLWSLGGPFLTAPFLGPLSLHGRHLATWFFVGGGLVWISFLFMRRVWEIARFWRFRRGTNHELGKGEIGFGALPLGGEIALALPNSGTTLDDSSVGQVGEKADHQTIQDATGEKLVVEGDSVARPHRLESGESIGIVDPDDSRARFWWLRYLASFAPGSRGRVEVIENPIPFTPSLVLRKFVVGLLVLVFLRWVISSDWMAELALLFSPVESFYTRLLLPLI